MAHPPPRLACRYYDGRHPRARAVTAEVHAGRLHLHGDGVERAVPLAGLAWPERQRHGERQMVLPDGAMLCHDDGPAWDAWAAASGRRDAPVVRWMQSWRAVAVALLLTGVLVGAAWAWGIPAVSRGVAAALPAAVSAEIGRHTLAALDRAGLAPSALPEAAQQRIRDTFTEALRRDAQAPPAWVLHFRAGGRMGLGPNALALPGGAIVLTDELVTLLADAPDVLTGVLAHELGHVRGRHGEAALVQAGLLSALAALWLGDVSSLLAAAPVLLGQMAYSRRAEREADAEALRVMQAAGLDPARMTVLFERLAHWRDVNGGQARTALPIALASHPADAERIRFFRDGR